MRVILDRRLTQLLRVLVGLTHMCVLVDPTLSTVRLLLGDGRDSTASFCAVAE